MSESSTSLSPQPSPFLRLPGAVPPPEGEQCDPGVPWHYGDPLAEQRTLLAGRAVVDLSHRGLVVVTGPDRLAWLHSLTTQHLTDLSPGAPVETLLLSPHGHVEHALHLVDDGERTWLGVEPGTAAAVVQWLNEMRFRRKVEVRDETGSWAALGVVVRPGQASMLEPVLAEVFAAARDAGGVPPAWQDPWPQPGPDTGVYTTFELAEHPGWARPWREVWVPRAELGSVLERLVVQGIAVAGSWAGEALRVAAWRPRSGRENDHRTLPHEADWLRTGLHLTKGCYRGQETVARVYHLGRPPRRLVMLHLDGSEHTGAVHGQAVHVAGGESERAVGAVTSAAYHHELGPIALAMLKRNVPVDATLSVVAGPGQPWVAAAQEVIA